MSVIEVARAAMGSHRTTLWTVDVLDEHDVLVRPLHEFVTGSIENNRFREINGGGSLDLAARPSEFPEDLDWGRIRFRPMQHLSGVEEPIPWGVYLPEVPKFEYDDDLGMMTATVSLMDKLCVPAQDSPAETFSLAEGTNVVQAVVQILTDLGETRIAATPSNLVLPASRSWLVTDEGMTWLRVVNDLLSIVNYFSLWVDLYGIYQIGPHRPSQTDGAAWTFSYGIPGRSSLYRAGWVRSEDWFQVPNRVVLVSQGSEDTEAMTAVASNNNPESKFSIPRRGGRVITRKETGVEAANHTVLNDLARRRLESLTGAVTNLEVETAPIPLWPNDRVALSPRGGATVQATVSSWTLPLVFDGLMSHTWREVVSL